MKYRHLGIQSRIENRFAKDKLLHFLFGTLIAFGMAFICNWFNLSYLWIIRVTLAVAVLKEVLDLTVRKRGFSISDVLWSMISAVLLYILFAL